MENAKEAVDEDVGREATGTEDLEAKDKEALKARAGDPAGDATSDVSPVAVAENPKAPVVSGAMDDPVRRAHGAAIEPF